MELESVPFDEGALEYNKGDFQLEINGGGALYNTMNPDADENMINKEQNEGQDMEEEDQSKNYNWVKVIGQGTFGTVFQAYDVRTRQSVAIKKVFQDPKYRNREFSIVIELDHPNAIKVHNYFFTPGDENPDEVYLNIVMDFIPGTLYRLLRYYKKTGQQFPNVLAKVLCYQMCRGMAYIKGLNICHRDIKPQNILVDISNFRLVLCDFGSAKKLEKGEASIAYICSRYYRAPELILGASEYGCEIDMWAVGCVIAEMFHGDPIFLGNNNKEQFLKIVQILGPPSSSDYKSMGYGHEINMPEFKPVGLKGILGDHMDPLAIDLMEKMMNFNREERIDPFRALLHPYFDELRKGRILINNRTVVDLFDFNEEEIGPNADIVPQLIPKWYKPPQKTSKG